LFYSIGPWQWKTEDDQSFWAAPDSTVGLVDLRPLAACAATGSHALNFGFFASEKKLDSSYVALGTDLEAELSLAQLDAWNKITGTKSLAGRKLLDVFCETLTIQADPEQGRRVQGLRSGQGGQFKLTLAGQTIWTHKFMGLSDPVWPRIKDAIQVDFRKNFEIDTMSPATALTAKIVVGDTGTHRRLLTDWMGKYKIADWREFVPQDLAKDVKGPLPKHTTITDAFTDDDDTFLEDHSTGGGWVWAQVGAANDYEIQSNQITRNHHYGGRYPCRAERDLSSDDHYSQHDCAFENIRISTRFASDTDTCYEASFSIFGSPNEVILYKIVTGVQTELETAACTSSGTKTGKLQSEDTSHTIYVDDVLKLTDVDASITGNVRCGFDHRDENQTSDNFEAADLAAGPSVKPAWYYDMIGRQ